MALRHDRIRELAIRSGSSALAELSASVAVVPEDVGHEIAEFGVWAVMAFECAARAASRESSSTASCRPRPGSIRW